MDDKMDNIKITINSYSYTIITAHIVKQFSVFRFETPILQGL